MASEKATVRLRGGASLVKCCPTFSWDSKYLFCCSGDLVKVFSISSGECVRNLRGHKAPVTCVQVNPRNKLQIFSSALDQTIVKWNYTDGVKLQTYQLRSPVIIFWPLGNRDNSVVTLRKTCAEGCEVSLCKLDKKESIRHKTLVERCSNDVRCVAMGTGNEYVVSVREKRMNICSLKKEWSVEHYLERDRFTCVACHPTECCIATGSTRGTIHFWWNFMSSKKVVKTLCHWHALPVLHLAFTAEGSYLLSGGYECVLVKWQYNSHHKDFLPRLGAPIRFVSCSPDNTLYITAHSHNVIQVLSNTFNLVQVYQGLTRSHRDSVETDPIPVGFLVDPSSGALVTNGQPGHLQFYCLHTDKQLYNLDIVCQNYISPIDLKKPTVVTEVKQAAFDDQGEWLVTLEMWDDGEMTPEIRLKFWQFNKQNQNFVLNTRVETAHEKQVNTVKFRPYQPGSSELSPMVVTTSDDGHFRLWSLVDDTDIYRKWSRWSCESVGFYRDLPAGRAAFSEDGSLLAVAFTSTLTIWDPDTNGLTTSLHRHADTNHIREMEFGLKNCSHLLVTCSQNMITVWNLLTCTVQWSVRLEVTALARDVNSDLMAVFTKNRDVFVFRPSHSTPVYTQGSVSHSDIIGAVFIPNSLESFNKGEKSLPWEEKSQLYFMNKDQLLLTVTSEEEDTSIRETATPVPHNLPQAPMKLLMAESRKSGVKQGRPLLLEGNLGQPGTQFVKQMLTTAAHVLPPVTSLCGSFLQSVLAANKSQSSKVDLEDSDTETNPAHEESSDSESDMETEDQTVQKHSTNSAGSRSNEETKTFDESSSYLERAFKEDSISNCEMENFSWLESVL